MKKLFINQIIQKIGNNQEVNFFAWIKYVRRHGGIIFCDAIDSTGIIQLVIIKKNNEDTFKKALKITPEISLEVKGHIRLRENEDKKDVLVKDIKIIGTVQIDISPKPRSEFSIFSPRYVNHILNNRHLYIRNEKYQAIFRFRHKLFKIIRGWFESQGFIEVHAPILTQIPLYGDKSVFTLDYYGSKVFLTQCVAFYLESAIFAFEKVFCLSPSFRAEESKGKRYLSEYWHLKSEIAFCNFEEIINFVENMLSHIIREINIQGREEINKLNDDNDLTPYTNAPYPRISYSEALEYLESKGKKIEWGKSIGADKIKFLGSEHSTPFWITGLPAAIEPFPYSLETLNHENNINRKTKTADLIAPSKFGEILGVAEKIYEAPELLQRMEEKGIHKDKRYDWYCDLRKIGSIPHSGFGMGIERLIRWLLKLDHVRDAIPFPRLFNRKPYP